ncbi:protein EPIDERMAL PATTERNING FACTOR 2-like isoform X1 [Panicum miliaceum]|uniref:Epidermal patterning factor-like protein n=1 Tax=Panicum miliaceum TaxID=4540 RepID=A0A3L6PXA3_PANMI|nr:protein EPIDERMAL PATTERNING FACTOR 2-like isoform X1 [Panicum miliaceum]
MGRHAPAGRAHRALLALAAVSLLAAVSDGIRPGPALENGATAAKMPIPAMQQGGSGDKQDLLLREEVRATGSSLPDCSHACGACSPCSRVMVSFKCSVAEPLPCPMVYRCMCRGKCYPVPSS